MIKNIKKNIETFLEYQQKNLERGDRIYYKINKKQLSINKQIHGGNYAIQYAISADELQYTKLIYVEMLPNNWEEHVKYAIVEAIHQYDLMLSNKTFRNENLTYNCHVSLEKILIKQENNLD